jgi:hypothetical protein
MVIVLVINLCFGEVNATMTNFLPHPLAPSPCVAREDVT